VIAPSPSSLYRGPIPKRWLAGFGLWSLLLSGIFFVDGMSADVSRLSGDQINILTIAAKKDHPDLFQRDLIVGNPQDTAYYIPWFIDVIRYLSLPDHDYIRGLNILLALTSIIYLWGWWLLFSLWGNRWTAAGLALLARGIMYPPGNELWGISALWTMLPRTLFTAVLPWVLWLWLRERANPASKAWPLIGFSCGALINIHPISGACVTCALLIADLVSGLREGLAMRAVLTRAIVGGVAIVLGAAPYLFIFLTNLGSMEVVDPVAFDRALRMRLAEMFLDVRLYLAEWLSPKWFVLAAGPWLLCAFVWRRLSPSDRRVAFTLGAFAVVCLCVSVIPATLETWLRGFGYTPRFGFQLVRTGKFLLVPSFVLVALLVARATDWMRGRGYPMRPIAAASIALCLLVVLTARHPFFDAVPLVGDDIVRQLLPPGDPPPTERDIQGLMSVMQWIQAHTPTDATFVGPRLLRVGALRPVIHDFAGAVMLVEGNPRAFVASAQRQRELRDAQEHKPTEVPRLLASWGADYWVTRTVAQDVRLAYANSEWFVYDLRPDSRSVLLNRAAPLRPRQPWTPE